MPSLRDVTIAGRHTFKVVAEPQDFWGWIDAGAWEVGTFAIFDRYLTPVTNFIDIGAWIGPTALYASRTVRHVWAVEPDPVAYEILQQNLAANPDLQNISTFPTAIMDYEGECNLGAAGLGCSVTRLTCWQNQTRVPCLTIPQFISRQSIPDPLFIKMDVEGAEALILRDHCFFQDHKPDLYVSLHKSWWTEGLWNVDEAMETVRKVGRLYRHRIGWKKEFYDVDIEGDFSDVLFTDGGPNA
jgi:FkbM family methyltransferase